ncbi:hypothetical protein KTR10_00285 [Candidatus Kaiserbacteria bacterium]|nr:hypothetical protein [Candidatus Kaiserbacteria bacterium]
MKTKNHKKEERTENGFTSKQETEIIRETEWAIKHAKRYTAEEVFERLGV